MSLKEFDWFEYIVFVLMLGVSTLIGVFFCCHHGGQKTVSEYLLGNKKMQIFPVAMSLIASSISGVTLLGVPSEIYFFGAQFFMCNVANVCVALGTLFIFLPVFYNLQLVSLYEYLEMRFNHWVRKLASILFTLAWFFFMPIVIYGPAIAFNQVSGLSINIVSPLVCAVCIFYTTFGGLKAVVWADALQGVIMLGSIFVVCVLGVIKVGSIGEVFNLAKQGGRLEIFDLNPDPTLRLSFWSSTVGLTFQWIAFTATSPAAVQRFISLPTLAQAKKSVILLLFGTCTFSFLSVFMGLVIYATYQNCDPKASGWIYKPDQLLPHFVLDVAGHVKGLPGLFVAGIVCAALSTLSTGLNTLSGTIYEDFIEPIFGKTTEKRASDIMKVISVVIGLLCASMVNIVEKMGEGIVEMTSKFSGITSGATLGIFVLGVMFPHANSSGAFVGAMVSLIIMFIVMVGRHLSGIKAYALPLGGNCSVIDLEEISNTSWSYTDVWNTTEMEFTTASLKNISSMPTEIMDNASDVFYPFRITVFYYGMCGLIIVLVVGLTVTYITGPNDLKDFNPELLAPFVRRFLPKSTKYSAVILKEVNSNKTVECIEKIPINVIEKNNLIQMGKNLNVSSDKTL